MHFNPRSVAAGLLLLALPCAAFARTRHAAPHQRHTSSKSHGSSRGHHAVAAAHHEAPPAMDADRASAIQSALIQRGYLAGEPSGHWDADSIAAMQKMQSDNGWQTKVTPDSRALIKMGLGPHSNDENMATN